MGYRTVVVFNNDQASTWENDPELGKKIARDMQRYSTSVNRINYTPLELIGGSVLECVHADVQTLAILDGYDGRPVACTHWYRGQTEADQELALLKELADKLGYRISRKPKKAPREFLLGDIGRE